MNRLRANLGMSVLGLALALLSCFGCRGTESQDSSTSSKEDSEKNKLVSFDDPEPLPFGIEVNRMLVKPGHIAEVQQNFKPGDKDLQGRIEGQTVTRTGAPLPVPGTRWSLNYTRDVSLPSNQAKRFDLRFFISPVYEQDDSAISNRPTLRTMIVDRSLGTPLTSPKLTPTTPLTANQFFLVVMADKVDEYQYLAKTDIVNWNTVLVDPLPLAYQLVLCKRNDSNWMIPSSFFGWTSTAYILWDDVDPTLLTTTQKQAMIDWLHWGGQLLISGPASWSRLRGSFLEEYLPAASAESVAVDTPLVESLTNNWALRVPKEGLLNSLTPSANSTESKEAKPQPDVPDEATNPEPSPDNPGLTISDDPSDINLQPIVPTADSPLDTLSPLPERKIPALQIQLAPQGSWITGAENLACERMIGRGRIVLTSIPLSEPYFARWNSFPGFINAVLLRRPARQWSESSISAKQSWESSTLKGRELDSKIATRLRIASRDADNSTSSKSASNPEGQADSWRGDEANGICSWNSDSRVSDAAKTILKNVAGINVPKLSTILSLLLGYLLALVPINWLIFHLLGKREWAWAAVPFISIAGVATVTYVAQLDIGFVSSYTEVAVVEAYANHPRSHVTRYSALYTSLSTPYEVTLQSDSGITVPMISRTSEFASPLIETIDFDYSSTDGNRIYPLNVLSNATTLLHTEQFIDMGGKFNFSTNNSGVSFTIQNQTNSTWQDVVIIRMNREGFLEAAIIGTFEAGSTKEGNFSSQSISTLDKKWNWKLSPMETSGDSSRENRKPKPNETSSLSTEMAKLMLILSGGKNLRPGETRLLGHSDNSPEGMTVRPSGSSLLRKSYLLVHLQSESLPPPRKDVSLPTLAASTRIKEDLSDETELKE